jgi:two-component sensor histidine kinase
VRERAFRQLAVVVAALFLAFVTLSGAFVWYDRSNEWLLHTHQVRNGIANAAQALTEAESAQRGYILTGDDLFSDRLEAARRETEAAISQLTALTEDNPEQQARLAALHQLATTRLAMIDHTVRVRRESGDATGAIYFIRTGEGAKAMAGVRRLVSDLDNEEKRLEAKRAAQVGAVRMVLLGALGAFTILLGWLFVKALRDINLDREAEADHAERLRQLLTDRTLLLDEVNHRVKNSLQQIASVVRLQSRALPDGEARAALEKTLDRIIAVGRVHEQLYKAGAEVGVFDAGAYAASLAEDLVNSLGREDVSLQTQVEPVALDLRQAAPLALILNELVTNALKYGCPDDRPCTIRVGLGTDGENYRLFVSDDGEGLPKGFTPRSKTSLGMRAVEALARQLGGRFIIEQPESGAAFAVIFPRS